MNKTITVIIPVYNTSYVLLKRCIDSIMNQTTLPTKIIISDDGSNSEDTLKFYTSIENLSNVEILKNKHGGLSSAVSKGVKNVKTDFLTFLDSDDTMEKNFIEYALDNIGNYDLLCTSYYKVYDEKKQVQMLLSNKQFETLSEMNFLKNNFFYNNHSFDAFQFTNVFRWGKIYKTSICFTFIDKYEELNYKMYEDMFFNYNYICNCKSVSCTSFIGINYFQYESSFSTVKNFSIEKLDSLIEKVDSGLKFICEKYNVNYENFSTLYFDISKYYLSRLIKVNNYKTSKNFFKLLNHKQEYKTSMSKVNIKGLSFKRKLYFRFLKAKFFLPIYFSFKKLV